MGLPSRSSNSPNLLEEVRRRILHCEQREAVSILTGADWWIYDRESWLLASRAGMLDQVMNRFGIRNGGDAIFPDGRADLYNYLIDRIRLINAGGKGIPSTLRQWKEADPLAYDHAATHDLIEKLCVTFKWKGKPREAWQAVLVMHDLDLEEACEALCANVAAYRAEDGMPISSSTEWAMKDFSNYRTAEKLRLVYRILCEFRWVEPTLDRNFKIRLTKAEKAKQKREAADPSARYPKDREQFIDFGVERLRRRAGRRVVNSLVEWRKIDKACYGEAVERNLHYQIMEKFTGGRIKARRFRNVIAFPSTDEMFIRFVTDIVRNIRTKKGQKITSALDWYRYHPMSYTRAVERGLFPAIAKAMEITYKSERHEQPTAAEIAD